MRVKVVILASAERDLKDLRAYIVKNFSAGDWRVTYAKLKETIRNVQDFPLAGSIPDEIEQLHLGQYRQVVSGLNRIIYEVRQDGVYIHIIADVRRDMKTLLMRRVLGMR